MTNKISIFYKLTQKEIIKPDSMELERKDEWIKQVQSTIEADWKPLIVKVTYELYDPEVENMMKFFNGPVVEYYAIQSREQLSPEVDPLTKKTVRESLLDDALGFDVVLLHKTTRRRKSTADFKTVRKWYEFLETLRETQFEPQGYEFPNSEDFWKKAEKYGYEQAKTIALSGLVHRLRAKLSTPPLA